MRIRVLGPFEVWSEAGPVAVGGIKQRGVLAMLALRVNEVVPAEVLVDGLWGELAPASAVNAVQVYVSRLRKVVGGDGDGGGDGAVLVRRGPGYVLQLPREAVDLFRFERLAAAGIAALAADPARAARLLREGLGLWRGRPLAEFAEEPFARAVVPGLEQQQLGALEACLEVELALGRHAALVGELERLVGEHPLHEGLH
jgi:DNA-binding SARP family transcriptional activator